MAARNSDELGDNDTYHFKYRVKQAGAARALRRAGVTEGEIMKGAGWKTRSMFDRYSIIDDADLAQGLAKRFNAKQTANTQPSVTSALR